MIKRVFQKTTNSITAAAYVLAVSSFVSALLGLLRDRLLAGRFGAGENLDIYYAAFRIPNLVYGLLVSGGIIAAFLPVFSEYFNKDKKKAWDLTSNSLNIFLFFSILICGLLFIFTPYLIKFVVPGFSLENKELTVMLTRIMFLSPIFFGVSNIFASILQYFNHFIVFALSPIFYNLGIIFGILFLAPRFGIKGLAFGVVLGALLHWLIQIPSAIINGFKYKPIFNLRSTGLKKIVYLMVPRTVSAFASQLNLIVITAIASTIGVGNISIFNFAEHLRVMPIHIIGGSFAVASYPFLARAWASGEQKNFLSSISVTFRQTLFLSIPISFLLFLLRGQLVRILLGTGKFDWVATRLTAASLGFFVLGIFAFCLIPFLARIFYSLQNTKTPLLTSLISLPVAIGFAFLFVHLFSFDNVFYHFFAKFLNIADIENISVIGLPLAVSLTGILEASMLLFLLKRKISSFPLKEIFSSFNKILIASLSMSLFVYLSLCLIDDFVNVLTVKGVLIQSVTATLIGFLSFWLFGYLLKIKELKSFQIKACSILKKRKIKLPVDDYEQENIR